MMRESIPNYILSSKNVELQFYDPLLPVYILPKPIRHYSKEIEYEDCLVKLLV